MPTPYETLSSKLDDMIVTMAGIKRDCASIVSKIRRDLASYLGIDISSLILMPQSGEPDPGKTYAPMGSVFINKHAVWPFRMKLSIKSDPSYDKKINFILPFVITQLPATYRLRLGHTNVMMDIPFGSRTGKLDTARFCNRIVKMIADVIEAYKTIPTHHVKQEFNLLMDGLNR